MKALSLVPAQRRQLTNPDGVGEEGDVNGWSL